jgi:DNA (cytosine-5)-methyltransferase 1
MPQEENSQGYCSERKGQEIGKPQAIKAANGWRQTIEIQAQDEWTYREAFLNVLDLFSGIGGFSLGLERAGMRTVAFCEIEPYCRAVLKNHWPNVPCYDDVRTLTADRLRADGIVPDVICGGFPCQDISEAGKLGGIEAERSGLWSEYGRVICEFRPNYVIVENVADLLLRGIERVLGDLASLGYDAWWSCLRACDLGAPHIRDRIWLVAYPKGCEAGREAAANCHREFAASRAHQGAQIGRCFSDFGGKDWHPEPRICRVDDGIQSNVVQVSAYGNAVVPQIPELIGRAIMQAEGLIP